MRHAAPNEIISLAIWLCSRENDSGINIFLDKGVSARCHRPGRGFIYPTTYAKNVAHRWTPLRRGYGVFCASAITQV